MFYDPIFPGLLTLPSNHFAFAAANTVSSLPGDLYNPLWLYGPTGTGKTALVHAMLQRLQDRNPTAQARYIQAEDLLQSLLNAIRRSALPQHRTEFSRLDMLVVDHMNILFDKPFSQIMVGDFLADLVKNGCQVVFCSTRSPQEMRHLTRILKHQCEFLLHMDILAPSPKERLTLTRTLARELGVPLTGSMTCRIAFAGHSPSRIRCLLTQLSAQQHLLGAGTADLSMALDQLLTREAAV